MTLLRALLLVRSAARPPADEWGHARRAILVRDRDRCQFRRLYGWGPTCGRPAEHVDHVVPVAWGGSSDASNLRAACARCNLAKGARPPAGWLAIRILRAVVVYAAVGWAVVRTAPGGDAGGRWAVVAPGGRVVRAFDTRADAERAAVVWDGGRGQLAVARAP